MKNLIYSILSIATAASMSSCGSIAGALSKGERPVFLIDMPKDLSVSFEGEKKSIAMEAFAGGGVGNTTITYYTTAVKLPYKHKGKLALNSGVNSTASVDLKPKGQRAIWWGNFILFPIVGHVLDGVTGNNKTLFPRYIDVPAALAGKPQGEWRSQGKLKRMTKKSARS